MDTLRQRQPGPAGAGLIVALIGVVIGCLIDVVVKAAAAEVDLLLLLSWRFLFGGALALAVFIALRRRVPRWAAIRFHTMRAAAQLAAAFFFFWGLTQLAVVEATVVGFSAVLFVAPLAWPILGEQVRAGSVAAALIGFAGVALALSGEPATASNSGDTNRWLGVGSVLVSAFAYALTLILTRLRSRQEDTVTLVMFSNVLPFFMLAPWLVWHSAEAGLPEARHLGVFALLGVLGLSVWVALTFAYRRVPAQRLAPLDYTALIWAGLLGWWVFGEVPSWQLWAGAAVIVAACLLVAGQQDEAVKPEPGDGRAPPP